MEIASRLGQSERTQGWVGAKMVTRCALFVLGIVAAALTAAVFGFTHIAGSGWLAGLALVAAAEVLVMRRRLFGAGIEEALEMCGLLALVFQAQSHEPDPLGVRTSLLVAAALAIAGFRFLNPFFITLSVAALSWAIDHWLAAGIAGTFCFAVAALALWAGAIEFRRPSYDRMLDWLAAIMPLSGYLWLAEGSASPWWLARWSLATFGAAALIVGIRRRRHAPLIAFMVCTGCMAYELRNVTGLSPEARLILWGSAALLLSLGLSKYLRTPRGGVSSNRGAQDDEFSDLLQLAGAGGLAPHAPQAAPPAQAAFKGGGGTGGGGGASGTY